MAREKPTVHWNPDKQRWMAWVRFPDGTRKKVERADQTDAERDLDDLLADREEARSPGVRRRRLATFDDVLDGWEAAGCPRATGTKHRRHAKKKSENTTNKAESLLRTHVRSVIGKLRVDRTGVELVESVFEKMDEKGLATSTIEHTWSYLNQACQHGLRLGTITTNPVNDVLLPAAKPSKQRRSLTVAQLEPMLEEAIPADPRPALWVTGLMCGLRPGELSGLRWCYLDIDGDEPHIVVAERANEVNKRYVGQAEPKTRRKGAIGLHPLVVAALRHHRAEMHLLGRYDADGFVFCTRNGTAISVSNLRRSFKRLCERARLGEGWTTYDLRHSFVSLVSDKIDDLSKVADLVGHSNTKTTEGYRHPVRETLPHAITAWNQLLDLAEAKRRKQNRTKKTSSRSAKAA